MPMRLEYDPRLVEEAVFLEVRRREAAGDRRLAEEFHRKTEPLYGRTWEHDDARDLAFRDVHAEFFHRLGFDEFIQEVLGRFPLLCRNVEQLAILKAIARRDESSELFVRAEDAGSPRPRHAAAIRIRAVAFAELEALETWLAREFYHLEDMVDPDFGYRPSLEMSDLTPARENLVRDRYRVLWDAWIETRLGGVGPTVVQGIERVFRSSAPEHRAQILDTVRSAKRLSHAELLRLAQTAAPAV